MEPVPFISAFLIGFTTTFTGYHLVKLIQSLIEVRKLKRRYRVKSPFVNKNGLRVPTIQAIGVSGFEHYEFVKFKNHETGEVWVDKIKIEIEGVKFL